MNATIELPILPVQFEPDGHIYTIGSAILPSVTQVMRPMSLMLYEGVPLDVMQNAADRGTRAHEQISNYIRYGLIEPDEDTQPYLDAFLEFESRYHPQFIASEYRVYHKTLMYAGTLDLAGFIEPDDGDGIDLIDIKCTAQFHRIMLSTQLAGYAEAVKSHGVKIRKRYGLQLLREGNPPYRFQEVPDGYKLFLHCLALHNAMAAERRP